MEHEIPTSYDELLAKYQQLLEENAALRNLELGKKLPNSENETFLRQSFENHRDFPDEDESVAQTIPPVSKSPSRSPSAEEIPLDISSPILENSDQEEPPPHPHPFLQEPFLRHLSAFIDYKGLAASRQVCALWYFFMTPAFLKRSKIVAQFSTAPRPSARLSGVPNQEPRPNLPADDLWLVDSSDSEEDLRGWRTIENFSKVYPYPKLSENLSQNTITRSQGTSTFRDLRTFYWRTKASSSVGNVTINKSQLVDTSLEADEIPIFDLGLDLDSKDLYIPSPPVPETLELLGFSCPSGWLRTYGYLVKRLSVDFGNFQRRERFGDVDPVSVVRLFQEFCPNVETLIVHKPNYKLNNAVRVDVVQAEEPEPTASLQLPTPNINLMANARFENILTLELTTYRSDHVQCVKEFLGSTPNVRHLSLSMFSVAPEVETQYLESAQAAGYLQNLETLKLPLGIKSTSLVFLVGVEFTRLKTLLLGRIRQTRWLRVPHEQQGQLMAFIDPSVLAELMQNISGTLEDLSLCVNLTHPDEIGLPLNTADIPVMPYLRRLEYKYARPEFTDSFAFLDNLPNLVELDVTAESQNNELISEKLLPEMFFSQHQELTRLKLNNIPVNFPAVVRIVRNFQHLRVLHLLLPLNSTDTGNSNVRRPLSRYLFKLRKLAKLEELQIKCFVVERDDFSYSVGFCLRYMRTLKRFAFHSMKTVPRLTTFAVDMGFCRAHSLICVELEDFIEDKDRIEASLKKKLLHTKFINCFVVNPLKNSAPPNLRFQEPTVRDDESSEKWSYEFEKYTDFASLRTSNDPDPNLVSSSLSFSTSDTDSLEFAIASF